MFTGGGTRGNVNFFIQRSVTVVVCVRTTLQKIHLICKERYGSNGGGEWVIYGTERYSCIGCVDTAKDLEEKNVHAFNFIHENEFFVS